MSNFEIQLITRKGTASMFDTVPCHYNHHFWRGGQILEILCHKRGINNVIIVNKIENKTENRIKDCLNHDKRRIQKHITAML